MKFSITQPHSVFIPPPGAIPLLWERLDGFSHEDLSFTRSGDEITATASDEPPLRMTRDEWLDRCRRTVVQIVRELCEQSAGLEADWYAISSGE